MFRHAEEVDYYSEISEWREYGLYEIVLLIPAVTLV